MGWMGTPGTVEHLLTKLICPHRPAPIQALQRCRSAPRCRLVQRAALVTRPVRAHPDVTISNGLEVEHLIDIWPTTTIMSPPWNRLGRGSRRTRDTPDGHCCCSNSAQPQRLASVEMLVHQILPHAYAHKVSTSRLNVPRALRGSSQSTTDTARQIADELHTLPVHSANAANGRRTHQRHVLETPRPTRDGG